MGNETICHLCVLVVMQPLPLLLLLQAAIDSITRSLALEWGYYGIRVSGIAPGWIGDTTGNSFSSRDSNIEPQAGSETLQVTVIVAMTDSIIMKYKAAPTLARVEMSTMLTLHHFSFHHWNLFCQSINLNELSTISLKAVTAMTTP